MQIGSVLTGVIIDIEVDTANEVTEDSPMTWGPVY